MPDREIVFTIDNGELGFVNSDGSGLVTQTVSQGGLGWPLGIHSVPAIGGPVTWSLSGNSLVGRFPSGNRAQAGPPLFIEKDGQVHDCAHNIDNLFGQERAWFISSTEIITVVLNKKYENKVVVVDVVSCEIKSVLYTNPDAGLREATLSSKNWLAIWRWNSQKAQEEVITIAPNGLQTMTLANAISPAWSADGEWLAYGLPEHGLYIVREDGSNKRKILDEIDTYVHLAPSWSPDGNWIVYDRRVPKEESHFEWAIFKVNVSTGEEYEIVRGGFDPNWRWSSSK